MAISSQNSSVCKLTLAKGLGASTGVGGVTPAGSFGSTAANIAVDSDKNQNIFLFSNLIALVCISESSFFHQSQLIPEIY